MISHELNECISEAEGMRFEIHNHVLVKESKIASIAKLQDEIKCLNINIAIAEKRLDGILNRLRQLIPDGSAIIVPIDLAKSDHQPVEQADGYTEIGRAD